MNVLVVSALRLWSLRGEGGAPSLAKTLKAYTEAGHNMLLITGDTALTHRHDSEVVDDVSIRVFRVPWMRYAKGVLWLLYFYPLFLISGVVTCLASIKRFRPQVIYGYEVHGALVARIVASLLRTPLVLRFQGTVLPLDIHGLDILRRIDHVLGFKTPAELYVITDDGTLADKVAERFGVPPSKIRFWRNGVRNELIAPRDDASIAKSRLGIAMNTPMVLSMCRLASWKAVHRLIKAVPKTIRMYRGNVQFIVAGDGPEKRRLEDLAKALDASSYVQFRGAIPYVETATYLDAADVVVSTSDISNVNNTVLEALYLGKPVVAVDSGATRELIQPMKSGLLVQPEDADGLAEAIARVLRDFELRATIENGARLFADANLLTWKQRLSKEIASVETLVRCYHPASEKTSAK